MKANALKYWWIWQNDLLIVHTPKYNGDKDIQAIGCCCVVVVVGVLLFVCRRYIQLIDLTHKSIVAKHHGCHCLSIFFSLLLLVCLLPSFAVYYEMIFTFTHMGNVLQSLMGFSCEYFTHSKAIENWSVSVYNGSSQLLIHISELTTSHFHMMAESVPYTQQPLINCIDSNIRNNGKLLNCMAARILCTPRRHIMCLKSSRTYQPTVVGFIMRSQLCGAHKLVACIIHYYTFGFNSEALKNAWYIQLTNK